MYYKELEVWKKSIELVKAIYKISELFPESEQFGLASQIRRAAVSIPSNIAEGNVRTYDKETIRFINIAIGSLAEVETQLIIAKELKFVDNIDEELNLLKQVNALAFGLRNYLDKRKWLINLSTYRLINLFI